MLLWFHLHMRRDAHEDHRTALEVVNIPENQALSQYPPETVRVQAVGEGWTLLRLGLRSPVVPISAAQSQVQDR